MCLSGGAAAEHQRSDTGLLARGESFLTQYAAGLGAGCAPCQMAGSIDNDLWMVALNVMAAIGYADVTGVGEVCGDLVLHVCSQGAGCGRLAQRPARTRENDS